MTQQAEQDMLTGIRVIEAATFAAGPTAGATLADLGADVIHIEEPSQGDPYRQFLSQAWPQAGTDQEFNASWELVNRNKRSLALSLRGEAGREVFTRLVERSDVFITNLLPDSIERLNIGYPVLKEINPRLIYVSITGYGSKGPFRLRRGYDFSAYWAASGLMRMLSSPDGVPAMQRPGMGDRSTGVIAAGAIGLALYHRERSGHGQAVELSLLHSGIWALGTDIQRAVTLGSPAPAHDRTRAPNPLWNTYQAKDGRWFMLTMSPNFDWKRFCRAIDQDDLAEDPRYVTVALRAEHCQELIQTLDAVFATRSRDQWEDRFGAHDLIWCAAYSPEEVVRHPQVAANAFFYQAEHPVVGKFPLLQPPLHFSATPPRWRRSAPTLGQHTTEILAELGYSSEQMEALKVAGVVRDATSNSSRG